MGNQQASNHPVQRASRAESAALHDVCVNHGRAYVGMPKKLLNGPDVGARFEQVGGEAVAEHVEGDRLANAGPGTGLLDRPLNGTVVDVIASELAAARLATEISRRKNEL